MWALSSYREGCVSREWLSSSQISWFIFLFTMTVRKPISTSGLWFPHTWDSMTVSVLTSLWTALIFRYSFPPFFLFFFMFLTLKLAPFLLKIYYHFLRWPLQEHEDKSIRAALENGYEVTSVCAEQRRPGSSSLRMSAFWDHLGWMGPTAIFVPAMTSSSYQRWMDWVVILLFDPHPPLTCDGWPLARHISSQSRGNNQLVI